MKLEIPRPLLEIMEKLEAAGYETVAVGGCVRDCLLGKQPHDWDMATAATPEEMKQVLSGYRLLETGLRHGTLTVLHGGEQVEITGSRNIVAVEIHQGTLFAVTAEGELLIAPPERLAEFRRQSWPAEWGTAPRKALLSTGDRLFLLLRGGIAEISPDTGHLQLLVRSQDAITAGGAIQNGALYFAMGRKVGRFFF